MGDSSLVPTLMIVGPSQIGKDTLMSRLRKEHAFDLHINATTRQPRSDANPSNPEYHFHTRSQFKDTIRSNGFVDWAYYSGEYYGVTPRDCSHSRPVMHCGAAMSIRIVQHFSDYIAVFMRPLNPQAHKRKIEARFDAATAKRRILMMEEELDHVDLFETVIDVDEYCNTDEVVAQLLILTRISHAI